MDCATASPSNVQCGPPPTSTTTATVGPPPNHPLAYTGSDSGVLLGIGVLIVMAGVLIVLFARALRDGQR